MKEIAKASDASVRRQPRSVHRDRKSTAWNACVVPSSFGTLINPISRAITPVPTNKTIAFTPKITNGLVHSFVTFDVDQPVTQREKLQRQTGGEENIGTGPERFVDRKPRVPAPADDQAAQSRQ